MNRSNDNERRWAILLAGGEGTRLSALTRQISGEATPKQFCRVIGDRPLIEQTRDRVSLIVSEKRIIMSLTHTHERFYRYMVSGHTSQNLVIQPQNRGTAPAILYALLRLAESAPNAEVGLFPCDHYVDDDRAFMRQVEFAFDTLRWRPELTILMGIRADRPETSYGWIEPGKPVDEGPVLSVRQFWEKPDREVAQELLQRGCLWNSFVIIARVSTLLGLYMMGLPDLYSSFRGIRSTFGTVSENATVQRLYDDLPSRSFSDDILMRQGVNLGVLPISGIHWNDLGEPHRVVETLNRLGIQPPWQAA